MIRVRTLGSLQIDDSAGGALAATVSASKRAALLCYLAVAVPRGFHRRDRLVALLWPELDQEHARGALRQALHALRRSVTNGTLVSAGDEQVGLDPAGYWCDAVAFEALVGQQRLDEALALYRGDLLDGFHLTGCLEFERWLDTERRRLRRRAGDAAWALAERAEGLERPAEAAKWGQTALDLSPDDEIMLQRFIGLLDRLGNRAGAFREYDRFARWLRRDYDAEPAPETQELMRRVRARIGPNRAVS